ncbi:MAG: tetratricopeptide repeat protein [Opitutaceae bacterium]
MYFLQAYPIPMMLELGAKVACILHVLRANRSTQWIWLIIIFPVGGPLIYFIAEIWPDLRGGRRGGLGLGVRLPQNPEKAIKRLTEELEFTNTVQKRVELAHAYAAAKRFPEAIETVNTCLRGVFKDDALLTFELAKLHFAAGQHREALASLDALHRLKSKHARYDRLLLAARCHEALGEISEARGSYEQAVLLSVGEEARCGFARLLAGQGEREEAQRLFDEILRNAKHGGGPYRRANREWIKQAQIQRNALSRQAG